VKPKFKHNVKTFRGVDRSEGLVYCEYNHGELVIAKKLPNRELNNNNRSFGAISSNLRKLYQTLSEEYKSDLASYTLMFRSVMYDPRKISMSAYSIFTKMLWKLKHQFPEIDLATITKDDILKNEYLVRTVIEAMDAGLLIQIDEANMLDSKM
jgi:hypothetical protein